MTKKIIVKQNPEAEVPTEVLAADIQAISQGIRKLRSGRLNERALLLLIQEAAPTTGGKYNRSRVGIPAIRAVLDGIEGLEAAFLRKPTKQI